MSLLAWYVSGWSHSRVAADGLVFALPSFPSVKSLDARPWLPIFGSQSRAIYCCGVRLIRQLQKLDLGGEEKGDDSAR